MPERSAIACPTGPIPERTALMKFQRIECKRITAPKSGKLFRSVDKKFAALLAQSIELEGMYEPIVVRRHPDKPGRFIVVQGLHRLYAKKDILKERVIECVVLPPMDKARHEMALITGNLWRRPMTTGQQTIAIKKWYKQFALANPKLIGDSAGGNARARNAASAKYDTTEDEETAGVATADLSVADNQSDVANMVAADVLRTVSGVSKRTAERWLRIARALTESQIAILDEINATSGDCERIAALERLERGRVFAMIASGMDARGALRKVRKGKPSTAARKVVV